jgi:hypothetical protein
MRDFIQRRATNGERVTWGSNDYVNFASVTVADLELLASRIANCCRQHTETKP